MSERVISGVKVPIIGDDERAHRAIERAVADLHKLKSAIAASGVATEKQARQVMVLEEQISSLTAKQEKSALLYGNSASKLGTYKEKIASVAGAVGGLSSVAGTAGGAIGKLGSIANSSFAAFATTGPIGLAIAGVGFLLSKYVENAANVEAAQKRMADAASNHRDKMIDLKAAIDGVGKSTAETSRIQAQAAANKAMYAYFEGGGYESIRRQTELEDQIRKLSRLGNLGGVSPVKEMNRLWGEVKQIEAERQQAIGNINEEFRAAVALGVKQMENESSVAKATKQTKDKEGWIAEIARRAKKDYEDRIALAKKEREELEKRNLLLAKVAGMGPVSGDVGRTVGGILGPSLGTNLLASGRTSDVGGSFVMRQQFGEELRRAAPGIGQSLGLAMKPTLAMVPDIAMGIGNKLHGALTAGFDSVVLTISDKLASMFEFMGLKQIGAGASKAGAAASATFSGSAAAGMAAGPLAVVIGGPIRSVVRSVIMGAAVGFASVMMEAVTATKSYARFQAIMGHSFKQLANALEPIFQSAAPTAALFVMYGKALSELLPVQQVMAPLGRSMFNAFKNLGVGALDVAIGFTSAREAVWRFIGDLSLGLESFLPGFQENLFEAGLAAYAMADTMDATVGDLAQARGELQATSYGDAMEAADLIADSALGLETFNDRLGGLGDTIDSVTASMRGIPDFFNAAQARRDVSNGGGAGGGGGSSGYIPGSLGSWNGILVSDGGVYIDKVVAPDADRFLYKSKRAQYVHGGRPLGSSQVKAYRGDFG